MSRRKPISAAAPGSADRRVQRTRRILRDALSTLLQERNWDEIGVQDICERADVGRSTFYAHYADKEDLLQGSLEQLRDFLQEPTSAPPAEDRDVHPALAFCLPMLEHAAEMRPLFHAMVGRRGGAL